MVTKTASTLPTLITTSREIYSPSSRVMLSRIITPVIGGSTAAGSASTPGIPMVFALATLTASTATHFVQRRRYARWPERQRDCPETGAEQKHRTSFDDGIFAGYRTGMSQGSADARAGHSDQGVIPVCHADPRNPDQPPAYCDWFRKGFRLGYDDAFHQPTPDEVRRAANR
jgi:hypothetical protein